MNIPASDHFTPIADKVFNAQREELPETLRMLRESKSASLGRRHFKAFRLRRASPTAAT
ncbi:MAG: hypothetical protein R2911_39400 [Caldilineaceae bacterium]